MDSPEFAIDSFQPSDFGFLRRMLAAAVYWRDETLPVDIDVALRRPDLLPLLDNWGRDGDVAFIATVGDSQIGAAWFRTCVRSFGYIDGETPEMGIGVEPEMRNRGIGSALIQQLIHAASASGFSQLSLSVEIDNPARRLYEQHGFQDYQVTDSAVTMVRKT